MVGLLIHERAHAGITPDVEQELPRTAEKAGGRSQIDTKEPKERKEWDRSREELLLAATGAEDPEGSMRRAGKQRPTCTSCGAMGEGTNCCS